MNGSPLEDAPTKSTPAVVSLIAFPSAFELLEPYVRATSSAPAASTRATSIRLPRPPARSTFPAPVMAIAPP